MPGDLNDAENGPYPYHYESRYDKAPDAESSNKGLIEGLKGTQINEAFSKMVSNVRQLYLDNIE